MNSIIQYFKQGLEVIINLSDLEKFRSEVAELPELYEYDLEYDEQEVKIKLKSIK